MDLLHIFALAAVQGVTEFLPVGAEAHLALLARVLPAPLDPGVVLLLNLGTVLAAAAYFRSEMMQALVGGYHLSVGRNSENARLAVRLFVGWVPAIAAGIALLLLGRQIGGEMTLLWLGWTMVGFGLLVFVADRLGMRLRRIEHMSGATALVIGIAQAIALVPGTGRIGVTMTALRLFGFERADAARFALLIGVVPVLALTGWNSWLLSRAGEWHGGYDGLIAAAVSFVASYVAIAFLMQWLRRGSLAPFALYRVILGAGILYVVYT
ncbi:MAG: undecaprenyl-diphosphate phosphatase [Alphaproteobacteria bacterium]|nr:undecaprenyl-diphosphate phosphatase [Alphaproteobacteria bacterium]